MKTITAAREAVTSTRKLHARQRKAVAQHLCNHIARDRAHCEKQGTVLNLFRSGALVPLGLDLAHPVRLKRLLQDAGWSPPKGALNVLCLVAQYFCNWKLLSAHEFAGELPKGIIEPNAAMAEMGGCHPDTWARYARPWLEENELLVGIPATERPPDGWRSRTGQPMNHREGCTMYQPGEALLDLFARRERRIRKSRRALVAEARRQLATTRKNSDPKALESSSTKNYSNRARGRRALLDALVPTVKRRRRSVRPAAARIVTAPASQTVVSSPATTVADESPSANRQRLVTKGVRGPATAGGEPESPRSSEPQLRGDRETERGVSAPPPENLAPQATPGAEPEIDVRSLLSSLAEQLGRRDRDGKPDNAPRPLGMQGVELPPSTGLLVSSLSKGGNTGELVRGLQANARKPRRNRAPPPPPASSSGFAASAEARSREAPRAESENRKSVGTGVLGDDGRTPDERAENERRRAAALARARAEAEQVGNERELEQPAHEDLEDAGDGKGGDDGEE